MPEIVLPARLPIPSALSQGLRALQFARARDVAEEPEELARLRDVALEKQAFAADAGGYGGPHDFVSTDFA